MHVRIGRREGFEECFASCDILLLVVWKLLEVSRGWRLRLASKKHHMQFFGTHTNCVPFSMRTTKENLEAFLQNWIIFVILPLYWNCVLSVVFCLPTCLPTRLSSTPANPTSTCNKTNFIDKNSL